MKANIKAQWLAALKSGNFVHGKSYLKQIRPVDGYVRHCCLGVLCEIMNPNWMERPDGVYNNVSISKEGTEPYYEPYYLPNQLGEEAGLTEEDVLNLANINDDINTFGYGPVIRQIETLPED